MLRDLISLASDTELPIVSMCRDIQGDACRWFFSFPRLRTGHIEPASGALKACAGRFIDALRPAHLECMDRCGGIVDHKASFPILLGNILVTAFELIAAFSSPVIRGLLQSLRNGFTEVGERYAIGSLLIHLPPFEVWLECYG